jgi:hypothetical protein
VEHVESNGEAIANFHGQFVAEGHALATACRQVADGVLKTSYPQRAIVVAHLSEVAAVLLTKHLHALAAGAAKFRNAGPASHAQEFFTT